MDRQVPVANRVVFNKIQESMRKKHLMKLNEIRNKTPSMYINRQHMQESPSIKQRFSSTFLQHKNLEIERNNIVLFNRIADIIRQKPKPIQNVVSKVFRSKRSSHLKKDNMIKAQNQLLEKRINQQQPTIKNKMFFQDRIKNEKYLKFMGRYPYLGPQRKVNTQMSLNEEYQWALPNNHRQIYNNFQQNYNIRIIEDLDKKSVLMMVVDQNKYQFEVEMNIHLFRKELSLHNQDFSLLVKNLRMNNFGKMYYLFQNKL